MPKRRVVGESRQEVLAVILLTCVLGERRDVLEQVFEEAQLPRGAQVCDQERSHPHQSQLRDCEHDNPDRYRQEHVRSAGADSPIHHRLRQQGKAEADYLIDGHREQNLPQRAAFAFDSMSQKRTENPASGAPVVRDHRGYGVQLRRIDRVDEQCGAGPSQGEALQPHPEPTRRRVVNANRSIVRAHHHHEVIAVHVRDPGSRKVPRASEGGAHPGQGKAYFAAGALEPKHACPARRNAGEIPQHGDRVRHAVVCEKHG